MPLPLAMMIPFMGIQSAVMAKQFGENFQFGKRRISAMSNDEFNKLTPKLMMSNANKELADMIPEMKESITSMNDFQEFLVREFLIMIDNIIKAGLGELLGLSQSSMDKIENSIEHFLHGHIHFGTADPTKTPTKTPVVNPITPLINALGPEIRSWSNVKLADIFLNKLHLYDAPSQSRITSVYNVRFPKRTITKTPVSYNTKDEAMIGFIKTEYKQGNLAINIHNNIIAFSRHKSDNFQKVMTYLAAEWAKARSLYNITKPASAQKAIRKKLWDAITELIQQINQFVTDNFKT